MTDLELLESLKNWVPLARHVVLSEAFWDVESARLKELYERDAKLEKAMIPTQEEMNRRFDL